MRLSAPRSAEWPARRSPRRPPTTPRHRHSPSAQTAGAEPALHAAPVLRSKGSLPEVTGLGVGSERWRDPSGMAGAGLAAQESPPGQRRIHRLPGRAECARVRRWRGGMGLVDSGRPESGRCIDGLAPQGWRGRRRLPSGGCSPGSPCGRARRCGRVPAGARSGLQPRSLQAAFELTLSAHGSPCSSRPPGVPAAARPRKLRDSQDHPRREAGPGGGEIHCGLAVEWLRGGRVLRKVGRE